MNSSGGPANSHRLNVLTLDGGGVRGLSSLLILQELMQQINSSIKDKTAKDEPTTAEPHNDAQPHEIFEFVAGTSTGGLIAIMLGKLGMSLEQCIESYHELSKTIFGKKHIRGKLTGGLGPTRYSGSRLRECVRNLIRDKTSNADLRMISTDNNDRIACAVVCREHLNMSPFSHFRSGPVCICSHLPCPTPFDCFTCDAARATSAAPTYFPVQKIFDRCFVDGGMEYNNPSSVIFEHCTQSIRVASSRRASYSMAPVLPQAAHSNLDFSNIRFVNIGTGTKSDDLQPRHRDILAKLVPTPIRMGIFLKTTLTQCAVESEKAANYMRVLAEVAGGSINLKWERFSADNGVCYIKLDKHKHLGQIETLTRQYLENPRVQRDLRRLGEEIATEYLQRYRTEAGQATSQAELIISTQDPSLPQPQSRPLLSPQLSDANTSMQSSDVFSRNDSPNSTRRTTPEASQELPASK